MPLGAAFRDGAGRVRVAGYRHHRRGRRGAHRGARSPLPGHPYPWYGSRDQVRVILTIKAARISQRGWARQRHD